MNRNNVSYCPEDKMIGVFDSGLGGLTAVKELSNILPYENIVYFGDTGRVPYGTRSNDTIIKYARQDIRFLLTHNVKLIVAACGTVSSVALPVLKNEFSVPVIGVLAPVCQAAVRATKNSRIGVLGTPGTINSGSYGRGIRALKRSCAVFEKACPMFVPLVENGYIESQATYIIAEEYLAPMMEDKVDTIILGCTHYPLLTKVISDIVGPDVAIINAGYETALYTKTILQENNLLSTSKKEGQCQYFVSDDVEKFSYLGGMFLERSINSGVTKINIDSY